MNRDRDEKRSRMKRRDLARRQVRGVWKEAHGQEIDRVPDTGPADDAVQHRESRHGDATRKPSFDARRDRIDLQRKPGTL